MKAKLILLAAIVGVLFGMIVIEYLRINDGTLHVVVCDVGQGDAVFIRTPRGHELLIDGGPDRSVLDCLSDNMPFWDRSIDVVLLTHPHTDHFQGLTDVLARYSVHTVLREKLDNSVPAYEEFEQAVHREKSTSKYVFAGTTVRFADGVTLTILAPTQQFLETENPTGFLNEENPPSLITHLQYGTLDILFPADSDREDLEVFVPRSLQPEIMFMPHHGSRNGIDIQLLERIRPHTAIISAGKNNRYGHPHTAVIDALKTHSVTAYRTDIHGQIKIRATGTSYSIVTEHNQAQ